MDAEPIYEDHPVCFNAKDLGTSNAYDVRLYAYLDLFAGAHGHTYGCHDIWQMYSAKRPSVNGPHIFWQEAMELPGANQMAHVRHLMTARPLLDRVPDQSLIVENNLSSAERIQATRGTDYAFVYSAMGKPFTVNPGKISGKSLRPPGSTHERAKPSPRVRSITRNHNSSSPLRRAMGRTGCWCSTMTRRTILACELIFVCKAVGVQAF